ncbi:MAG TPA: protein kinase [Gemmatimonadales bacterium]|nr:protein kinase [Gemmatimonadales bacterium]
MHCANCGHKLEDAWTACPICGARVGGGADPRAVAAGDLSQTSLIRDTLAAEYEILEELGRGGMAIVFRAREKALDREVAVKVLPFSLAFDAEFVERFQREARTAAQLEHPNIIPIYRVGRSGQVIFFVMKLVRGGSLATLLQGGGRLPPADIRRILVESGRALNYAAEKGIVHRDIKPDNIMFDEHGASVITDFGIAKAASGQRLTGTGMSIGTPHYMSPEQARAQETDGRSDIYSLGVVAYQALLGQVPYDGEDSFSIGYKHIMEPIPEPVLNTADERRLFQVIKKMIAKDPADRFQTGLDLVEEIEGRPAAPRRISGASTRERLAAMPTTPIPAVTADATGARPARTSGPGRPVMQRSAAQRDLRERKNPLGWILLLVLLGAGGVFGAGKLGYGPMAKAPPADSTPAPVAPVAVAPADTTKPDSTSPDTGTADTTRADTTKSDSAASPLPRVPASPPPSGPPGFLRIVGLPRGTTVMVDDQAPDSTPIRLNPGPHIVAISAPLHVFYVDTVNIRSGLELTFSPDLTPVGEPLRTRRGGTQSLGPVDTSAPTCDRPGRGYNKDQVCWDVRAAPLAPPRVPVPAGMFPTPRPAILLVKVNADGTTAEVAPLRPSDSAEFNDLANRYALAMRWTPATKDGVAVVGWTQIRLEPVTQ